MKNTLIIALLVSFTSLNAATTDGFNKRFKLKRNAAGELTSVKMIKFTKSFSLKPYLVQIKNDLKEEIQRLGQKSHQAELDAFIESISDTDAMLAANDDNPRIVRAALENLPNLDVDATFEEVSKERVLAKFEFDLKKALKMLDLSIVADPTDARYFYRKNVTYQVVKKALDFAKKRFDSIPLLNFASFLIVRVHDLVVEQRVFNQNMLLHYTENFAAKDLGLTESELDKVRSSIYESRIGALNYFESNRAAADWANYGTNKFYTVVRASNTRLRRSGALYSKKARINYAFAHAELDGQKVILDVVNTKHQFSSKMPVAYYYSNPKKVKRFRSLLELANAGLGFLPIPGWIKSNVHNFVESFYVQQRRDEGALVGFFESNQNTKMYKAIRSQINNPYILF